MTLLFRVDDGAVTGNLHSLSKRALATVSGSNHVAVLLINRAYILCIRHSHADTIAKIEYIREAPGLPQDDEDDVDSVVPLNLRPDEHRHLSVNAASNGCCKTSQRFVWAAWTPVAVLHNNSIVAALCTVNITNRIEVWVAKTPQGSAIYEVEKICDVTTLLEGQLRHDTCHVVTAGNGDWNKLRYLAKMSLQAGGTKICKFAEPPIEKRLDGFLGLISSHRMLFLVWFNSAHEPSDSGEQSDSDDKGDGGPSIPGSKAVVDPEAMQLDNVDMALEMFDVRNIASCFPVKGVSTYTAGLSVKLIGVVNTGVLTSLDACLRELTQRRQTYDVFVGTENGYIKRFSIELEYSDPVNCAIGDCNTLVHLPTSVEMLRYFRYQGDASEHEFLVSIAHNRVLIYDIKNQKCHQHQCGNYPLLSYMAEPMFLYNAMIAKIVVLDVVGTTYMITLDSEFIMHRVQEGKNDYELVPCYLHNTETVALKACAGNMGLELHYNLLSRNIFATLVTLMVEKRDISHFSAAVAFVVNTAEWETTEAMFSVKESTLDVSLKQLTWERFVSYAQKEEPFELWRQLLGVLCEKGNEKGELWAALLYLVAYAESGGNATEKLPVLSINPSCANLVWRLLRKLELSDDYLQHVIHMATVLYKGQIGKLLDST